jgi:hypothetical protein
VSVADVFQEDLGPAVVARVQAHLGDAAQLRVARTQVGWARRRGFAFVWSPQRWQGRSAAPVVLTLAFTEPEPSPRWKEVHEVRPGLFNHHLEIRDLAEVDDEVLAWVDRAWEQAG